MLVERRTQYRKVASSNHERSGGRIFFFRVNFVCWLLFGVHFTPVLPQWHIKNPSHSAKSAGGRLHLNTHIPLTQRSQIGLTMSVSRHSMGTYRKRSPTHNSSGNTRPQSSQLTEPLWTDSGRKSGDIVRELISTDKKRRRGLNGPTFPKIWKSHHHHHTAVVNCRVNTSVVSSRQYSCRGQQSSTVSWAVELYIRRER